VNTNWQSRCTDENIERYRGIPHGLRVEANLVFNNPAVAIEVGLLEVFRFLVEERGVDMNMQRVVWNSFNTDNPRRMIFPAIPLAMVRGDVDILECLLSPDKFDLSNTSRLVVSTSMFRALRCSLTPKVKDECFLAFIRHPKVDVNIVGMNDDTPLFHCLQIMGKKEMLARTARRYERYERNVEHCALRIVSLLEAGADPAPRCVTFARNKLENDPENPHWRLVVEKMESMGNRIV